MTSSGEHGRRLRQERTARRVVVDAAELRPQPRTWDWGPQGRPSGAARFAAGVVAGVALVVAVVSMPGASGQSSDPAPVKGVAAGTEPPPVTVPPGLPPADELARLLEQQTAPPPPPPPSEPVPAVASVPAPQPLRLVPGEHIPEWAWAGPAQLAPVGIAAMARAVGCTPAQAVIATAVGLAESNGRTDAVGDEWLQNKTWGPSVGVHQIRSLHAEKFTGKVRDGHAGLHDAWHNAWAMASISQNCTNWQPWTMFTNGRWISRTEEAIWGVLQAEGVVR
jgi:hypothetical protein